MRRLVPAPHWALVAVMTLALAFAAATGLGVRALERLAAAQEAALGQERMVRLLAPNDEVSLREARTALARSPDVREARILSAEEAQTLLSGWAEDAAIPAEALEGLRLIVVRLEARAPADIAERLQADLAEQGLSIEVTGPGPAARSTARGAGGSQFAGLSFAAFIVAAGVVGFASRAVAAGHGPAAGLLASLGATRAQTQSAIARPVAGAGFAAGLLGALLAAAGWAALAGLWPEAQAIRPSGDAPLDLADLAPLAAAPLIGYVAARSGGRAGAGRSFDRADFPR